MAQHIIFSVQLKTNEYAVLYPLFTINRWIKGYYDDVTETVRIYLSESEDPAGVPVGEALAGPYISGTPKIAFPHGADRNDLGYTFCDGLDRVNYKVNIEVQSRSSFLGPYDFPYVTQTIQTGHWACEIHQCDIAFDLLATDITEDSGASDGSVVLDSSTSAGPPKYTQNPNAQYSSADAFFPDGYPIDPDATSYTFTGLAAGSYTFYALDSYNCKTQLTVIIPPTAPVYGVRWRFEYEDTKVLFDGRVDVEERDYAGSITTVKGSGDPVIRSWLGESITDIFNTLIGYVLQLNLLSETDFQFVDLFTQDERKYRVKSYRDGAVNFQGFVTPMLYSEPYYIKQNYPVNITATDQIGTLKDIEFTDDFGNLITQQISFMDAICIILRKTNVDLPIFEAVNIYAVGMDGTPINFLNPSFEQGVLSPWVNVPFGGTLSVFQWFTGNIADTDPGPGSYSGAQALAQPRPNSTENWPEGDYEVTINAGQEDATNGVGLYLWGFDDAAGNGAVSFGLIDTMDDGDPASDYTATITVNASKRYLGIGFSRFGPSGATHIFVNSIDIIASPDDVVESSPLQQCFFDPTVYIKDGKPMKCNEVLHFLLASFGARLYQANAQWIVESIEQKTGTVNYRIFNLSGELQDTGTSYATVDIKRGVESDRVAYKNRSGLLTILPSYNNISFNIDFTIDNNLLTTGFEKEHIVEIDGSAPQILGWSYDLTNGDGIGFGIESLNDDTKTGGADNKSALFVDFADCTDYKEIILTHEVFDLAPVSEANLIFSFDVYFRALFNNIVSYIDFSVKIGDMYLLPIGIPTDNDETLIDGEYIRVYVDRPLSWTQFKKTVFSRQRSFSTTLEGPVVVKMRISNNKLYEYGSLTALRAQVTEDNEIRDNLTRVKVLDDDVIRFYTYEVSAEADNAPDVIRPDDYSTRLWKLEKTVAIPEDETFWLNGVLIDNIKLAFDIDFPEELIYTKSNDENIKLDLEKPLIHGDLALYPEDVETPANFDSNYQRLLNNWIRFSDGTPTSLWYRGYSSERRSLLDILMRMYQGQMSSPSFKFSGSFDCDVDPSLFNLFLEVRLNRKLMAMSLSIHDADNELEAELLELKAGSDGEPPADIYEFTEEFSTELDA